MRGIFDRPAQEALLQSAKLACARSNPGRLVFSGAGL